MRGFTVLEVLVGLIVFTIGMMGFTGMMMVMTAGGYRAKKLDEAGTILFSSTEKMSGVPLALLGTDTVPPPDNGYDNALIAGDGPFNRNGEKSGTGPFLYYKYMVICEDADSGVAAAPEADREHCGSLGSSNRPLELACNGLGLDPAREKLIRMLVSWSDRDGTCRWLHSDSLVFQ